MSSEVDSSSIRQGFWVNYSKGTILGATITTNQQTANVVVALVAISVSVGASSLWNIFLFFFHQFRSTSQPKDGLYRQQQVLYRSLSTPGSIAMDSLKLATMWRGIAPNANLRCLIPILLASVFALATLAAGIFSSYLVNTTNLEVLIHGRDCRVWNSTAWYESSYYQQPSHQSAFAAVANLYFTQPRAYADRCYEDGPLPSNCNTYIQPRIGITATNTSCPFASGWCIDNVPALTLDSGYLNSNDVLDINAKPRDRVQMHRTTTCAPLPVAPHLQTFSAADDRESFFNAFGRWPLSDEQIWILSYGSDPLGSKNYNPNQTYFQSTISSNVTLGQYTVYNGVQYSSATVGSGGSVVVLPGLQRPDADVNINIIWMNRVALEHPTDDPVYSAHSVDPLGYTSDFPAGVTGCIEQYEFCINNAQECAAISGVTIDGFETRFPNATHKQIATLQLLGESTSITGYSIPMSAEPPYLASNAILASPVAAFDLSPNQWQLDIIKIEGYVWALFQIALTWQAAGPLNDSGPAFALPNNTNAHRDVCRSQKVVKAGGFANINVFALSFIIAVAGLLVILDYAIVRVGILLHKVRRHFSPGIQFWIEDGAFQLQRAAYEGKNIATWTRLDKEIPTTVSCEKMRDLDWYSQASLSTHASSKPPSLVAPRPSSVNQSGGVISPVLQQAQSTHQQQNSSSQNLQGPASSSQQASVQHQQAQPAVNFQSAAPSPLQATGHQQQGQSSLNHAPAPLSQTQGGQQHAPSSPTLAGATSVWHQQTQP